MAARRSIIHSSLFRPSSTLLRQPLATSSIRPLSVSSRSLKDKYPDNLSTDDSVKTDQYPDDEHAVKKADKGVDHDVQSSNVKAGREYVHIPNPPQTILPLHPPSLFRIRDSYTT